MCTHKSMGEQLDDPVRQLQTNLANRVFHWVIVAYFDNLTFRQLWKFTGTNGFQASLPLQGLLAGSHYIYRMI